MTKSKETKMKGVNSNTAEELSDTKQSTKSLEPNLKEEAKTTAEKL